MVIQNEKFIQVFHKKDASLETSIIGVIKICGDNLKQ